MSWIIKETYSFNKYIGQDNKIVSNISEAKEFKTKKEATAISNKIKNNTQVLKKN